MRGMRLIVALAFLLAIAVGCDTSSDSKPSLVPDRDGVVFNHLYKCSQVGPSSTTEWCADPAGSEQIRFVKTGANTYSVEDVPASGWQQIGTVSGLNFHWHADSPNGYTETGTWTFSADGLTFEGDSSYVADSGAYHGICTGTGAVDPATPATPAAIGECP
jgi:hypothetical protein